MGKVSNFKKQISNLNFAKSHGVSYNLPKKKKRKKEKEIAIIEECVLKI